MKLYIQRFNLVKYGKEIFSYHGDILWNDLPNEFKNTTSFDAFRYLVSSWNLYVKALIVTCIKEFINMWSIF